MGRTTQGGNETLGRTKTVVPSAQGRTDTLGRGGTPGGTGRGGTPGGTGRTDTPGRGGTPGGTGRRGRRYSESEEYDSDSDSRTESSNQLDHPDKFNPLRYRTQFNL